VKTISGRKVIGACFDGDSGPKCRLVAYLIREFRYEYAAETLGMALDYGDSFGYPEYLTEYVKLRYGSCELRQSAQGLPVKLDGVLWAIENTRGHVSGHVKHIIKTMGYADQHSPLFFWWS
jgi:hypothetical protein